MKTIALDYDNTYTDNPEFWKEFIKNASKVYEVIICTGRHAEDMQEVCDAFEWDVWGDWLTDTHYTSGQAKKDFLKECGYDVKEIIWIDDKVKGILKNHKSYKE